MAISEDIFRSADTAHSDNYAPTGLVGPFRGNSISTGDLAPRFQRLAQPITNL
jgi:hypothetical protein